MTRRLPLTIGQKATDAMLGGFALLNLLLYVWGGREWFSIVAAAVCAAACVGTLALQIKTQRYRYETARLRSELGR